MKIRRLGYACINDELNSRKERVSTTRGIKKKTFKKEGIEKVAQLSLQNISDLLTILKWNEERGIKLFRLGSGMFPWKSEWKWADVLTTEHRLRLELSGLFARKREHRLTFHPGPFNKLCSTDGRILGNTISELEMHACIFHEMGFKPSYENSINIHLGAAYGDKNKTAKNWVKHYTKYLSSELQKSLTIENDDKKALYTTEDLYYLVYEKCGVPIMFDFHHEALNPSKNWTMRKAAEMALSTWPDDITPLFHWSESRSEEQSDESINKVAHSDYTYGPLPDFPLSRPIDLMIEAKKKEKNINLLTYANGEKVHGK